MISPTGVTYSNYWNAIKAGNPTHVRFTFLGQNIVLDDSDIYLNSGVTVTDMFNGDTDLVFGKTLSKQITVTFLNSSKLNNLRWTGEFTLEFGVEIGNPATTYWVNMGYFSGEKPKNVTSVQTIEFTAYDRMGKFDVLADEFVKSLIYPKTVQQIYNALCTYVGIQNVAGDELANIKNRSFSSAPSDMQGYSCRDILAMLAEACGCYAKITSAGKVKLVWFTDNTAHAVTGTEEFSVESGDVNDGMTWDEADTFTWNEFDNFTWNDVCGYQEAMRIDRLYVKQLSNDLSINYPNDYGTMIYSIVDNPFLPVSTYNDVTDYLAPIYDRLYNFGGYLPVNLDCVGNWCVEAGDIITIDVNNLTIAFPIFVKTMKWNGAINDSYETTGNSIRPIYDNDSTKQRVFTSNKIEAFVEDYVEDYTESNYYKLRSGISIEPSGVKISGGKYLKLESGSTLDIHASGTLELTGSSVLIKSGSTFDVDSTNLRITSSTGDMEVVDGGLKVKKHVSGSLDYNFYLGGIIGNYFDQEPLKAALLPVKEQSIVNSQTVVTYPIELRVDDELSTPGVEYETEILFGRTRFSKDLHLYSQTPTYQILGGVHIETVNRNSGSVLQSAVESALGLFENIDARFIEAYKVTANTVEYTYLSQVSSKDIKHDIQSLPSFGNKIDGLKPVTFVYDNDKEERTRMGLIYEDTVKVMPEICTKDESNKAINYVELIPALLKEIQELRIRVKTLEEREV